MTLEKVLLVKYKVLPKERKQELLDFAEFFEQKEAKPKLKPRRSLKGALVGLDINISEEDIREARNEMGHGQMEDFD